MQTILRFVVRWVVRPIFNPRVPIPRQRRLLTLATRLRLLPRGVRCTAESLGGVPGQCNTAADADGTTAVLYLHGGAYCCGSPETHRTLCARLAGSARTAVHALDYRLAPEHPFPAALDDAVAAYAALLEQGLSPARVVVAGDSAGGGLALALALRLRDQGLPMPALLYLISPWVDMTFSGESATARAAIDPMITAAWGLACRQHYAGASQFDEPLLSPLFADLQGMPAMLIDVGSDEVLYSDAERLAARAAQAGVAVELRVYDGLWHVFHVFAGIWRTANAALDGAAEKIRARTAAAG
ncbi:MAG: alpha/beta hydrolase [Salinisphaera sp.]|nr:alpha/beta hydrolase [Salinisphaera sp.]